MAIELMSSHTIYDFREFSIHQSIITPLSILSNRSPEAKVLHEKCSVGYPFEMTHVESSNPGPQQMDRAAQEFQPGTKHNLNFQKAIDIDPRYLQRASQIKANWALITIFCLPD